ncbi:MAG TPA: flagellar export chaperone FliS [Urbifossiella sp.]|jgi:flagellin-specific chaperone FliS|nr:flagellar export chaperone FliS [Urbifossiella sp.]
MNPYAAYRRPEPSTGWTRIDLLLALYDGAIERLDRAEAALVRGDQAAAIPLMSKVQLIVTELAAGVRTDITPEAGTNALRLYEFVTHRLSEPRVDRVRDARKILVTLREGFQAIRAEATEMERTGQFHAASRLQMVLATA